MPGDHKQKKKKQVKDIRVSKVRKADVSDINRVTRWDERTFNKRREMPKKREEEHIPAEVRNDVDLHPYQAIGKLKKRLAKVANYNAEADPEASTGEWLSKYKKKRKSKVRKAGAKKKTEKKLPYSKYTVPQDYNTTDFQQRPDILSNAGIDTDNTFWKKQIDENMYVDYEKIPKGKDKRSIRKEIKRSDRENFNVEQERKYDKSIKSSKLKNRLAKIRKADGGIAPNFANPSKSHDPNEKKKKKQQTAGLHDNTGIKKTKAKPKNKQYLERRKKKNYVKNAIKGKSTGQPISDKREYQRKKLKRRLNNMGDFSGNMTPTPEQIEKKKIRVKKEADAAKKLYDKRHKGGKPKVKKARTKKRIKRKNIEVHPEGYGLTQDQPAVTYDDYDVTSRESDSPYGRSYGGSEVISDKAIEKSNSILGRWQKRHFKLNPKTYEYDVPDRNNFAKIRRATEIIDPREKKKKTVRPDSNVQKVSQRIAEMKVDMAHNHKIQFRVHEGSQYRRASLTKQEGKYAKYWLLNAKQTNGNGWGVSQTSIAKNINKFIGRPFVVTAKQWIPESEYGDQFEHPYLPTNNISQIINHQEKFRVGSIVDIIEKNGDYHAVIEMNSKFAHMMLPPFCSPAIFQNNPGEADGQIADWEALHLAGLVEDPAYGAQIALLKGSCMGTADACSVQFKVAKQAKTVCHKKMKNLKGRLAKVRLAYDPPEVIEPYDPLHEEPSIKEHLEEQITSPEQRRKYRKVISTEEKALGKKKVSKPRRMVIRDDRYFEDFGPPEKDQVHYNEMKKWAKLKGRLAAVIKPKKPKGVDNTIDKLVKEVKDPANKEDLLNRLDTTSNEYGPKNFGTTKPKDFSSRRKVSKKKQKISKLRQRLVRTAKPIIQETGEGITFRKVNPRPGFPGGKDTYGYHKVPIHPSNAVLIRPKDPENFMDLVNHFRKIHETNDFAKYTQGSVQQSIPLRYLKNDIKHMSGDKLKFHADISTAKGKAFKKGDILMRRVGGTPEKGKYGTVGETFYIEEDSPAGEVFNAPSKYKRHGKLRSATIKPLTKKKKKGKAIRKVSSKSK